MATTISDLAIHPIKYRVIKELEYLKGYSENLQNYIDENSQPGKNPFLDYLELIKSNKNENIEDFFRLYNFGEFLNKFGFYNQIAWNSLFVSHYTLLEVEMRSLCMHLYEKNEYNLKLNDLNNKGIFQAKLYLKKVVGLTEIFGFQEWQRITYYNSIRNNIVHESSSLESSKNEEKITEFRNQQKNFKITNHNKNVILNFKFVQEVNDTIKNFLLGIFDLTLEVNQNSDQ